MQIALHKNARTTPAVRALIAASDETASVLAQRFGITEQTVYKWKKRESVQDRSHTAHPHTRARNGGGASAPNSAAPP